MATSVLRDQQYTFGEWSLLAAEKALLIRNDLAACCCDDRCHDCRSWCFCMIRLARVNFRHCSAHRYFRRFSAQNRPQSSQVLEGVCLIGAKTAKAGTAGRTNADISWQPAALQDRRVGDAGEDCNRWRDLDSSLSTGDKAGFKAMETQRIADSDQVEGCALSEQSDGYRVLGHERCIACEFQKHGRTVNASSYCSLLERLKTAIWTKRKGLLTQGVIPLYDNTWPHTARLTLETVEQLGIEVLPHPPYSPDLVPSDYHLFGPMKKMLGGQKFASDTEVQSVVRQWLGQQPASFFG